MKYKPILASFKFLFVHGTEASILLVNLSITLALIVVNHLSISTAASTPLKTSPVYFSPQFSFL
jgi:hypothetical protein